MPRVKITIKPDGSFTYELQGVAGKKGHKLTDFLDELADVKEVKLTREAYLPEQNNQVQNKKGE